MTDLWIRIAGQNLRSSYFRGHQTVRRRHFLRQAVDVHSQKSLLPYFPFHINDFKPPRARHPPAGRANLLQIPVETPPACPLPTPPQPPSTNTPPTSPP